MHMIWKGGARDRPTGARVSRCISVHFRFQEILPMHQSYSTVLRQKILPKATIFYFYKQDLSGSSCSMRSHELPIKFISTLLALYHQVQDLNSFRCYETHNTNSVWSD